MDAGKMPQMKSVDYFRLGVPYGPSMAAARHVAGTCPDNAKELITAIAQNPDAYLEHDSHQVRSLANWIRFERSERDALGLS